MNLKKFLLVLLLVPSVVSPNVKPTKKVAGIKALESYEKAVEALKTPSDELQCLTLTLYHEARGESTEGVLAVAEVILNRKANPRYPKTICKVVKHQLVKGVWQFSFWKEKKLLQKPVDKKSWDRMESIAKIALILHKNSFDTIQGSMYYHTVDIKSSWNTSPKLKFVKRIGRHKFYRRVK